MYKLLRKNLKKIHHIIILQISIKISIKKKTSNHRFNLFDINNQILSNLLYQYIFKSLPRYISTTRFVHIIFKYLNHISMEYVMQRTRKIDYEDLRSFDRKSWEKATLSPFGVWTQPRRVYVSINYIIKTVM